MKIFKRIIIIFLVLLVLAQIPFIYRRYQTGKLAEKIASLDAQRTTHTDPNFKEYVGVIHAHTSLGGHSTGSFDELIAAANSNNLDFVLMTEHVSDTIDTAALTLNGVYGKTLFVGGNELDTSDGDRFLLIPGGGEAAKARTSGTAAFLAKAKEENKLALITYPERFKSWDSAFDGIEVFSLHTAAKQMNWLTALGDLIWSYPSYPELTLAKAWMRPDVNLEKFDKKASDFNETREDGTESARKVWLFAGTDAHSNIGFHLFGDDVGNKLINIKLDSYETIFRMARLHFWLPADTNLTRENLIEAVREGSFYVGLDALGNTDGFVFRADVESPILLGSEPQLGKLEQLGHVRLLNLVARVPSSGRIVIFKNGEKFKEELGNEISYVGKTDPAVYRVEVYREDLGPPFDKMPWIISNPIYVR